MKKLISLIIFISVHIHIVCAQKFYLHQYKDSMYNHNGIAFLHDSIKHKYLFCIKQYSFDLPKKTVDNYIVTDTAGNIILNKKEFLPVDSTIHYKDFFRLNNEQYLMVGYRNIDNKYITYRRVPYMRITDTNLNVIFEKNIFTGDTTEFYATLHSIINKNGNLVISGYLDSFVNGMPLKSVVYFYEVDILGNILKHNKLDTSFFNSTSTTYSIIERIDSLGYLIVNDFDTYHFNHLDTNFNVVRRANDYYNYNLMGFSPLSLSYLLSMGNGYCLQSQFEGKYNKMWHWIMKYKDDMTFVKYAVTEAEVDTVADFAHRPAYNHPLSYDKKNNIIYCLTNTRTDNYGGLLSNINYVQVSKYDTALNLIWTRFFGGYDYNYIANSIFYVENKQCMVLANRTNIDTSSPIKSETFIFKLDSMGTVTSVINLSNPTKAEVYVYPNPATHTLHFVMQNIAEGSSIALYNLYGNKVAEVRKGNSPNTSIDIAQLPAGIFTYRISDKNKQLVSGKWVKE